MSNKVLVAMVGINPWSAINSVWAAIVTQDFVPDEVHLLASGKEAVVSAQKVVSCIDLIMAKMKKNCTIEVLEVDPDDPSSSFEKACDTIDKIKKKHPEAEIALDITSGRKMETVGAIMAGYRRKALKHIFYLSINSDANQHRDCPLFMIPSSLYSSTDLLKGR